MYPKQSALLHINRPFAEIAMTKRSEGACDNDILDYCTSIARKALKEAKIDFRGPKAITRLCVNQGHMHKKGIMFTSMIMSMAISEIIGVEYLWTSDSDSMISHDTLTRTMAMIAADANVAGASTALYIHNKDETVLSQLGNAIYLNELYLARSFSGSVKANDCQSGPCAAFRLSAVRGELIPWYEQKVWGHWMVCETHEILPREPRSNTNHCVVLGYKRRSASDHTFAKNGLESCVCPGYFDRH